MAYVVSKDGDKRKGVSSMVIMNNVYDIKKEKKKKKEKNKHAHA